MFTLDNYVYVGNIMFTFEILVQILVHVCRCVCMCVDACTCGIIGLIQLS